MADEEQDQKTEQPTSKRLGEAREKGQLPISKETSTWVIFIGILVVMKWFAAPMAENLIATLRVFLEMPHVMTLEGPSLQTLFYHTAVQVLEATALIFIIMVIAAVAGPMLQNGFFISLEVITPDLTKLSPLSGLKRLFSMTALVELGKSFGKMVVLGGAVFFLLSPIVADSPSFAARPLMQVIAYMHDKAVHIIIVLLLIFTFIALGDLFYQRFSYYKSLRMTKQEVKDEYKQQEGDPKIKQRLRQLRVDKARKRMMSQVPKADVVITNPTHYAIAMKYDSTKNTAPIVIAKGINLIADRIRELAEDNRIPLVSNPPLARALFDTVEIDREIPTQHYRAVAEVISYVYKLKARKY